MRKVLIILWLVLLFLQNFSVKSQNLTDIECTTACAYDFGAEVIMIKIFMFIIKMSILSH